MAPGPDYELPNIEIRRAANGFVIWLSAEHHTARELYVFETLASLVAHLKAILK